MQRSGGVAIDKALEQQGVFYIGDHSFDAAKIGPGQLSGSARWACRNLLPAPAPLRIVTLIRNPADQLVSKFARDAYRADSTNNERSTTSKGIDTNGGLTEELVAKYLQTGKYLERLNWFDTEFKQVLGVDIYTHPFDKERGVQRFQQGRYSVLVLRSELSDDIKSQALSDFIGVANLNIPRTNVGEHSPYGEKYAALKAQVKIPEEYWSVIEASPYVQHFLPCNEVDETRKRYVDR